MKGSLRIEYVPLDQLKRWPRNPKSHDLGAIHQSIGRFGFVSPVIINEKTGYILAGHGRLDTLVQMKAEGREPPERVVDNGKGEWLVPVIRGIRLPEGEDEAYAIADNRTVELGGWDEAKLAVVLEDLAKGSGFEGVGFDGDDLDRMLEGWGEPEAEPQEPGRLTDRFIVPPFSVLDARQGYWQERKRAWVELGIQSELGRHGNLLGFSEAAMLKRGGKTAYDQESLDRIQGQERIGTSIFDPVLSELVYRWFCPPGGAVLDPFAGGSVRGIVAAYLGYKYTGVDLSEEQIRANAQQLKHIERSKAWEPPAWIIGDSRRLPELFNSKVDLVFSCPPYYDLEQYTEDERDLSRAKTYGDFIAAYREIVQLSLSLLRDKRFACFVVADIRDRQGLYRDFVSDTIAAFRDCGLGLYNEAILVTAVGSLPIRVGRQFGKNRKLGKTHQNVLVFYKGDPGEIAKEFPEVEVGALEESEEE